MGIKNLRAYLAAHHKIKPFTRRVHASQFKNQSIAVDGNMLMWSAVKKPGLKPDQFVLPLMSSLGNFLQHKIQPVMVFDGDKINTVKMNTVIKERQTKRTAEKEKFHKTKEAHATVARTVETTKMQIQKHKKTVKEAETTDPAAKTEKQQKKAEKAKQFLAKLETQAKTLDSELKDLEKQKQKQSVSSRKPRFGDWRNFNEILKHIGIQQMKGIGDGEALCSLMSMKGIVSGVYTNDMDALTFGSQRLLYDLNEQTVGELHLDEVLKALGLSYSQFVDFSVLLGSDYMDTNHLSPRDPVRILKMIKESVKSEELFEKIVTINKRTEEDYKGLIAARDEFVKVHVSEDVPKFERQEINFDGLRKHLLSMKSRDVTVSELESAFEHFRLKIEPKAVTETISLFTPKPYVVEVAKPIDIVQSSDPVISLFDVLKRLKERIFNKPWL